MMRHLITVACLAPLLSLAQEIPLFDGTSLEGWTTVERDAAFWRAENGVIAADSNGKRMPRNTFLFSEKEYGDFEFRCMFRLMGDPKTGMVNSGIQFRSAKLDNGHAKGYQADIGEPTWWGCLYDEHRRGLIARSDVSTLRSTLKPFGWNSYVIRAVGDRINLYINGIRTIEYIERDANIPRKGHFALQLHSGGICRIEYKDITVRHIAPPPAPAPKADAEETTDASAKTPKTVLFESFEKETYEGWTVSGEAFGKGPLRVAKTPSYQGNLNAVGQRCVNSHASAPGAEVGAKDVPTGSLLSKPFPLELPYIQMHIGGGAHTHGTCVDLLIDGKRVASLTGSGANTMQRKEMDVRAHKGKQAQLRIVDNVSGGWGNIGVDHIVFSETPLKESPAMPSSSAQDGVSADRQRAGFSVPEGFVVELVASEAHGVINPSDLTFDDGGRLWTHTGSMYPLDPDPGASWGKLLKMMDDPDTLRKDERFRRVRMMYEGKARGDDKVLIIEEPHRAPRTARVFADGLAIPQSVLPYKSGAFVAHGSQVIYLDDTNNDGKMDTRETVLDGFGYTDSHTMAHLLVRAPGGWVNFSHGALNKGEVTAVKSGAKTRVDFCKTGRFSLDGSRLNLVNSGLNNIWGFVLRASGQWYGSEANDLGLSITPMEPGTGFSGIGKERLRSYQPWFPSLHKFRVGGTGLSGIAFADDTSGSFPSTWRDVAFIANPITSKINAVTIQRKPDGTVSAKHLPDFLTSDDPWFRPVNIAFGPDGCLYIADFYNKIISHNEVSRTHPDRDKAHGRIWRIRHESQRERCIPDFYALDDAELPTHLASPSLWAKRAAWHQIVDRGATQLLPQIIKLCADPDLDINTRIIALWSIEGLKHYDAVLMKALLAVPEDDLRREAVRALGNLSRPSAELATLLTPLKNDPNVMVRTQVLRSIGEQAQVDATLVDILVSFCQPDIAGNTLGGPYERSFERFLARKALEQYPEALTAYLESDAAKQQPQEHIAWASQALSTSGRVATFLTQWDSMKTRPLDESEFIVLCELLPNPQVQARVKPFFEEGDTDALVTMALARQADVQSPALSALLEQPCRRLLDSKDAALVARGVEAVERLRVNGTDKKIAALLKPDTDPAMALTCIAILNRRASAHTTALSALLADGPKSAPVTIAAIAALCSADAQSATQAAQAGLPELSDTERSGLAAALSKTASGSRVLLDLLADTRMDRSLLAAGDVERIFAFHKTDTGAQTLNDARLADIARKEAAYKETFKRLTHVAEKGHGDAAKGKLLFTAACLSCHSVADEGAGFAPPLDGSAHRDIEGLLTAILRPDAAIEGNYELYRIHKTDGSSIEGYLEAHTDKGATLRFMGGASVFTPATEIQRANFVAGRSVMPAGLVDAWSDDQIADLLAHIKALK